MSFGFGSNNNSNTTFGGFGSSNTGGGFGATNNASTGGSLFGGNTATSGGFGGFGSTNTTSSPFGTNNKPTFGAAPTTSSGGGLFGGSTANTSTSGGFGSGGGFGASTNTGGFGASTGGGLFGQNKPATGGFGSATTGSSSLFGGGNTSGGFGATGTANSNPFSTNTNTSTGFGGSNTGGGFTFGGSNTAATTNNNGTAGTPFQAVTEKPSGAGNVTDSYQSITMQGPYNQKSFEELRVEDYAQGRRFGNSNGQAGGFGQSTGFGGFGATNANTSTGGGGLFGSSNTATTGTTGFGASTGGGFGSTNAGGFGANTNPSGGLFGANKPATGGLFGNTATSGATTGGFGSGTTNNTGGGLFGGGTGGFGATNTQNNNTGGGLFGSSNNQQNQNKTGFGFGATNANTGTGFGATNTAGGGLFGGGSTNTNTGGGLFGNSNNQQPQQNSLFGNTNTNTTGGLFGNNQNKPATGGLFGNTNNTSNTGGGLFGAQNNNQQQQNNPFGGSTNTGGGLFGNQNKPATGGLFGGGAPTANTGGGLFGAQNNQNQAGSSLFGNSANTGGGLFGNQNKPATGGLFGASANNNSGGGLFGGSLGQNNNQQNNTSSLFGGGLGQNQNQQSTNTNSLFGGSLGQSTQQGPQQNQLHASLTQSPYGHEQLFSSLGASTPPVGPLATPLTGARPAPRKTPSLLAGARLNTPVYSPRGSTMGRNGYGFSYSTYGTPGSAFTSGSLTPGASSLLRPTGSLGSALTSRLNKSLSTSNLRGDASGSRGSLLRPTPFSPDSTPGRYEPGSMRKLKIDRSLRTDLFGQNEPKAIEGGRDSDGDAARKRVSFGQSSSQETTAEPNASNALVRTEDQDDNVPSGLMRAGPSKQPPPKPQQPEMEQMNGKVLTTVPEDTEAPRPSSAPGTNLPAEKVTKRTEAGEYWTKPAMKDLKNMSRQQLKNVGNFVVGREGVGRVEFGSVDLTNTPLDDICGNIVQLNPRSATVYQDDHDKPSMGKALNVPSTIYLENSWPRSHGGRKMVNAKSGKEYDKHIARLKRVQGTHFLAYDANTGIWSFKVDHFTTYGLDDDDDESEYPEDSQMVGDSSGLSDAPDTPTGGQQDETMQSVETNIGEMDDTFQFKLDRRSQLSVPGGFDSEGILDDFDELDEHEPDEDNSHAMSGGLGEGDGDFTSPGGAVQAPSPGAVERYHSSMMDEDLEEAVEEVEQGVPGSFRAEPSMPKSILKPSTGLDVFMSPQKLATDSWEEQLERTMSPKKRDRQALREMQQNLFQATADDDGQAKMSLLGRSALEQSYLAQRSAKKTKANDKAALGQSAAFTGSMDIMKSLFEKEAPAGKKLAAGVKDFENPNPKRRRLSQDLREGDEDWYSCLTPVVANDNVVMFPAPAAASAISGELEPSRLRSLHDSHKQIRFAKFSTPDDLQTQVLTIQQESTSIKAGRGFPAASSPSDILFATLADSVQDDLSTSARETSLWRLCSILFDPLDVGCSAFATSVPEHRLEELTPRIRLDALRTFWAELVAPHAGEALRKAKTAEEKALIYLTKNDIVSTCEALMGAGDYKLATMISQLPASETSREMMKEQIGVWRERSDWAEFSEPMRALYSILAGEVCVVQGKSGAAENRVQELCIAEKFGLSWQQSFALRLHFGGHRDLSEVVQAYVTDLEDGRGLVPPTTIWPDLKETRDSVVEVLQLAADVGEPLQMFDAKAVSGLHFDSRLVWQMATTLNAKEICGLPADKLDVLTLNFAMELESAGSLVDAVWVLLHIDANDGARRAAIDAILHRNAGAIDEPSESEDDPSTFDQLAQACQVPASLLWKAKALYAQSRLKDPALQTLWLLNAGLINEAHDVLCTTLGPQAVIEQDYKTLSRILARFPETKPEEWEIGGHVYGEFLAMVTAKRGRGIDLRSLTKGLRDMEKRGGSLEERVAVVEMQTVLREVVREEEGETKKFSRTSGEAGREGMAMLERYRVAMGMVG